MYDDWYERSVGADCLYEGYIMKSTGEKFSKHEREWLDAAVQLTTWDTQSGAELWHSSTDWEAGNRIGVRIFPVTRSVYLRALEQRLLGGTKEQLLALLQKVGDQIDEPHGADARLLRKIDELLAAGRKLGKRELAERTWKALSAAKTPEDYLVVASRMVTRQWRGRVLVRTDDGTSLS